MATVRGTGRDGKQLAETELRTRIEKDRISPWLGWVGSMIESIFTYKAGSLV